MNNTMNLLTMITPAMMIPIFPLLGFLILSLFGKKLGLMSGWIASMAILGSFLCSINLFIGLEGDQQLNFSIFNWINSGDLQIEFGFLIDQLSLIMLLVVTGIGFLIHLYSIGYMHHDEGFTRFFSYLNLFVFFMLLLVMGNNYAVMFIGWEGVGLCSYLLIGFWFKNPDYNNAAKKAFIMNRIGDLGFLIGIFALIFHFGTLDFIDVQNQLTGFESNAPILVFITLMLFIGATGKSAQLPLYTWLPDAMAGPTPVSALIHAATMVTAGIYMICRSNLLFALAPYTLHIILIVGVATSLFAAIIGIKQNDIKKVLAYSTVSQLGLMFAAIGLGAFESSLFHVMTHAFFKALLFLGAGSVIHAMGGEQDIRKMGGLSKSIKITFVTFLIATLAISGIFPFAGFFSKDEILAKAFEHNLLAWALLSISSMITAFYMFRLLFLVFYGQFRGTEQQAKHLHESPISMTFPLMVLAILSAFGGFFGLPAVFDSTHQLNVFLAPIFNASKLVTTEVHALSHSQEWMLMGIATFAALMSIFFAFSLYIKKQQLPENDADLTGFSKIVANKFYVDEFYHKVFVNPIMIISDLLLVLVDKLIIDMVVNLTAIIVDALGRLYRLIQTGSTGFYLIAMVLSMVIVMFIQIIL